MTPFDVIDLQPQAWQTVSRSFSAGKLKGTYLLHGPTGSGHWSLAITMAALINCAKPFEKSQIVSPCGECDSCRRILALSSPDLLCAVPVGPHKSLEEGIELTQKVLTLKGKEPFRIATGALNANISIRIAREFKKRLSRLVDEGVHRVVLFYGMDKMRWSAADALLKIIEEPPEDVLIILTTDQPDAIPITVKSRSKKIRLARVSVSSLTKMLQDNFDLSPHRSDVLARIADGSPGRAIAMLDSTDDGELSSRSVWFLLFKSLCREESPETITHLADMINVRKQEEIVELLTFWQSLIRDCFNFAISADEEAIINADFAGEITNLAHYFSNVQIVDKLTGEIKLALADLRLNVHILGAIVALIFKMKGHLRSAAA